MVCNVGASLARVCAPDARGRRGDLILGLARAADYLGDHPSFGSTVGRVANRVAGAEVEIDGIRHALQANDGRHQLHGGDDGFGRAIFDAEPITGPGFEGVRFTRVCPAGEGGYPGTLEVEVTIRLLADGAIRIDFGATTDRATFFAPSHHAYWNLRDGGASAVDDHLLEIRASQVLPVDAAGIPRGGWRDVAGTPFDFRRPRRLGEAVDLAHPERGGYDHDFRLDGPSGVLRPVARLEDPVSGRRLDVETTFPGLQLYTGNGLDGSWVGHGGQAYARRSGVCLEAQLHPDAPHQPWRESALLRPGRRFEATTLYRPSWSDGAEASQPAGEGAAARARTRRS